MREIIFDTETTGLNPDDGERIIEIGAVELENRFPTGRTFHVYINPEGRLVHPDAFNVHGISDAFLRDKPVFSAICDEFFEFVSDANLVAHNAAFDMRFINAERLRLSLPGFPEDRVVDTLALARRRHPMGPNSLDALCSRYGIDNSHRTRHGALLDAELLAEVYIEMTGGRQAALILETGNPDLPAGRDETVVENTRRQRPEPLPVRLTPEEKLAHTAFLATLGETLIWHRYDCD